jgi:hypothetical protein
MCNFLDDCIERLQFGCLVVEEKILYKCIVDITCKDWLLNGDGTISHDNETITIKSLESLRSIYNIHCKGKK